MLERWGGFVARRALAVLLAGMALTVAAAVYGFGVFDSLSSGGFDDPDSEATIEREAEEDAFGNRSVDIDAIYSSDELTADSPEFRSAVEAVVAQLPDDAVSAVVPYYDAPPEQGLVSEDGHSVQVLISLQGDNQDAVMDNYDKVEPGLHAEGLQTDLAGPMAVYNDVNEITSEDLERAELISMPVVPRRSPSSHQPSSPPGWVCPPGPGLAWSPRSSTCNTASRRIGRGCRPSRSARVTPATWPARPATSPRTRPPTSTPASHPRRTGGCPGPGSRRWLRPPSSPPTPTPPPPGKKQPHGRSSPRPPGPPTTGCAGSTPRRLRHHRPDRCHRRLPRQGAARHGRHFRPGPAPGQAVLIMANPTHAVKILHAYQTWHHQQTSEPATDPTDDASVPTPERFDPTQAAELLDETKLLPTVWLFAHLADDSPVARVEGAEPVTTEWVRRHLGERCRFKINPVLDPLEPGPGRRLRDPAPTSTSHPFVDTSRRLPVRGQHHPRHADRPHHPLDRRTCRGR